MRKLVSATRLLKPILLEGKTHTVLLEFDQCSTQFLQPNLNKMLLFILTG